MSTVLWLALVFVAFLAGMLTASILAAGARADDMTSYELGFHHGRTEKHRRE